MSFYELKQEFVAALEESKGIVASDEFVLAFILEKLLKILEIEAETGPSSVENYNENKVGENKQVGAVLTDEILELEPTFLIPRKTTKQAIKQLLLFVRIVKNAPEIGLDEFSLITSLGRKIQRPHLELIWLFTGSKYKLLFGLSAYIMSLQGPAQQFLMKQIINCAFWTANNDDKMKRRLCKILSYILPEILTASYSNPETNEQLVGYKKLADEVLAEIHSRFLFDDPSLSWNRQVLLAFFEDALLPAALKKEYRLDHLDQIICKPMTLTLEDVHRQQETIAAQTELEYRAGRETLFSILRQTNINAELLELVEKRIQEGRINWEMLLLIITVAANIEESHFQLESESPSTFFSSLKEIIRKMISSSVKSKDSKGVLGAFVITRHCCLISPEKFDRYEKWYVNTFGNETTTLARSPQRFSFLASILTDMFPNDPISFLQVHTTYWPFVPTGMRSVWSDYIGSAKIRISEEVEPEPTAETEYQPNPKNPIQLDVERVVKAFESNQKIPAAITEMMMFRKRYYNEQFLPALLRKPHGAPPSDIKIRLIEALRVAGKIPNAVYKSCTSNLL